jgi:hypothetical protein
MQKIIPIDEKLNTKKLLFQLKFRVNFLNSDFSDALSDKISASMKQGIIKVSDIFRQIQLKKIAKKLTEQLAQN